MSSGKSGSINAQLLTGPSAGLTIATATDATLTGANNVAQISQFNVSGNLIFRNQADLLVSGSLTAGTVAAPDPRNIGAIGLIVGGNLVLGSAASPAVLNAGTIGLSVTGTISQPAGALVAGLLNDLRQPGAPPAASLIHLDGSNTITAIGEFSARQGLSFTDTVPLAVLGTITAGGVLAPAVANGATLQLSVAGGLSVGTSGLPGALNAGTVIMQPTGAITEPNGAVTANLLLLPAAGQAVARSTVIDLSGNNAIAALGGINATGDVSINSRVAMTVSGPITLGLPSLPNAANANTLTLASAGDLTIGAPLAAGTISLLAAGTISQTGGIITANRLTGPAAGLAQSSAAAVTLEAANSVIELGAFTTTGNFSLVDAVPLTVTGAVAAGANSATLRLASAGPIAIGSGNQQAVVSGATVALLTASAISETSASSIVTNLLIGPNSGAAPAALGSVNLAGANAIASLSSFTTSGDFLLLNGVSMSVAGTIAAGGATTGTPNLGHLTIGLSLGTLAIGTAIGAGVLSAGTIAVSAANGITEPNGRISATLLNEQTGLAGVPQSASVSLQSPANAITTLGTITTLAGDLTLSSTGALTVIGQISASNRLVVQTTGAMTVLGNVSGGPGGVQLSADLGIQQVSGGITASATGSLLNIMSAQGSFIQLAGASMTSAGSVNITSEGPIGIGASVIAPHGVLTLNSLSGGVAENGIGGNKGTVFVQGVSASAAGSVILDSSSNRIGALTGGAIGGRLVLVTTSQLSITGTITVGADANIAAGPAIEQVSGSLVAGGSGVVIASRFGTFTQDHGSFIGATDNNGTVAISAAAAGATLEIGGTLSAPGTSGTVALSAPLGGILELDRLAQPGAPVFGPGQIVATHLTTNARQSTALDPVGAANVVSVVDSLISSNGTIGLVDTASLLINGPVQAAGGVRLLSQGNLALAANVSVTSGSGATVLQSAGNLSAPTGSSITATDLTLATPGAISLGGLVSSGRLFLGGPNGGQAALVDLATGVTLLTGSAGAPLGNASSASWPTAAGSSAGAFIAAQNLVIGWNTTIGGVSGAATQTLRVDLSGSGVIDTVGGLVAGTTTLLVNLGSRAHLSGNVALGGLSIAYPRGATGNVNLSGTVRGVGGQAAAQISAIAPGPSALYQINACPIASVACFVVSTERLPQTIPIRDLDIHPARDTIDDAEVLLPNVSRDDL